MNSKCELMLEQFRMYFPNLYERGDDWWKSGPYHITVLLNDDSRVEFDSSDNTIRWVSRVDCTVNSESLRKEIGRNIRKFIIYRGLRQQDICEKIGITEAMLSRYLNGTSMPGVDKLHNLASVLNCQIGDLLGDYEERNT
jgi:DNA-binding Xre family transcriptional regulator